MIDREPVTRKIVLIAKDLEELRTVVGGGKVAYLSDPRNEVLAERYLERSITRMIDINFHLIVGATKASK